MKLDFNPEALRDRYKQERDKLVRADGNAQYVEVNAHYLDDPYVKPGFTRTPLTGEVDVVVGGGFGGLLAGVCLHEAVIVKMEVFGSHNSPRRVLPTVPEYGFIRLRI